MVTRYTKDSPPSLQCFMPTYTPQLRIFSTGPGRGEGGPFPGPGPNPMRGHPQQPPTPPTSGPIPQQQQQPTGIFQVRSTPFRAGSPAQQRMRPPGPYIHPSQIQQVPYHQVQMMPMSMSYQAPPTSFFPPMVVQQQFYPPHPPPGAQVYYRQPLPPRQNQGHVPNAQPGGPSQPITGISQPPAQPVLEKKKRPNALKITDPASGEDVVDKMLSEEKPQKSGVPAEFARLVAVSLNEDDQQPPSRGSNYSESENPSEPDTLANASSSGVSSPKLEGSSREMEGPVDEPLPPVENSLGYPEIPMQGWPPQIPVPAEPFISMPVLMMPPPEPAPREFVNSHMPPGWPPDPVAGPVGPPIGPGVTVVPGVVPPQVGPVKKSVTPVVSALTQGPTVDLGQFPALAPQRIGGHQSPARNKRKTQRLEQEQSVDSRPQVMERTASPLQAPPPVPEFVAPPVEQIVAPPVVEPPPVVKAPSPVHIVAPPPIVSQPIPPPQAKSPHTAVPAKQDIEPLPEVRNILEQQGPAVTVPLTSSLEQPAVSKTSISEQPAPVVAAPTVVATPSPPVKSSQAEPAPSQDAKSNHKNKSKKHQQRQEQQHQVRQASPPPPAQPQKQVEVEPQLPVAPPAAVVTPVAEPEVVQPPAPATKQIVVEPEPEVMEEPQTEPYEDSLVAAMNAENTKLSAAQMQETTNDVSDIPLENNNVPNNNKNNVTVIVEPSNEVNPVIEYSKPALKHVYKDDQWSPVNLAGKKKYERDFIMKLMNDPQSQKRPDNLPNLEALKDSRGPPREQNMRGNLMQGRHGVDMMPSFGGKSSSMRSGSSMKRPSQLSNKPKSNKSQPPIQVSLSLNEEVKLRECATPWKPTRNDATSNTTEEERKTESLYKKVRGVLNKLTPEKFETLVNQVKQLPIDNVARLRGVINLVFEKAVDEPGFSVAYAEMCKVLEQMSVPDDEKPPNADGSPQSANFRAILLFRCQQEFEKDSGAELNSEQRIKEIEDETDPEKKKELKLIWEEDQRRVRVKAVGNVRFVGELFKKQMITGVIMFTCIQQLLRLHTEESLECLCKLLTTIGKQLEETANGWKAQARAKAIAAGGNPDQAVKEVQSIDRYFAQLQEMVRSKDKRLSNRVKFMIQDLIDLRNHQWVPRRDDAKPKTMEQVAKDAEREQIESSMALNTPSHDKRGGRQDSRHNMGGGGKQGGSDNMGWTAVTNSSRGVKYNVEPEKLRAGLNEISLGSEVSLGSSRQFQWGTPKPDHRKQQQQPPMIMSMTQNKFSILVNDGEKPSSRGSSLKGGPPADSRHNSDRMRGFSPFPASAQDDSRNARNSQLGPGSGSRANSRDPIVPPTTASTAPQAPSPSAATPTLSSDDNVRITQSLLEEFLNILDFDNASQNLAESFTNDADKDALVCNMMIICVDKNSQSRRGAGRLLADFLLTGGITRNNFLNGLLSFIELFEDLVADAPKIWEYLAEMTVDVVTDGLGILPILEALKIAPARLCPEGPWRTIATLLRLIHAERPNAPIIQSSVPVLKKFVGNQDYDKFIQKHNLEFLETPAAEPVAFNSAKTTEQLERLLRRKVAFTQITQWITCNVGKAETEPDFIFALVSAVLEISVNRKTDQLKLDMATFKKHFQLLVRYIDNQDNRELHALYALQAKVNQWQYPRGVLSELCQALNQEGVISIESFNNWKSSDDSQYAEGKGVCMASLNSFFVVLNEGDDDEGS